MRRGRRKEEGREKDGEKRIGMKGGRRRKEGRTKKGGVRRTKKRRSVFDVSMCRDTYIAQGGAQ